MRKITAPAAVKELVGFFSVLLYQKFYRQIQGLTLSRIFAQVLKQHPWLNITHSLSSAHHPESRGAIERFHQTLKSMLRSYCPGLNKDWDEGVHLLCVAHEVVQESVGFSPAELPFCRHGAWSSQAP